MSDTNSSGGIGFVGLLQVAFIVLKLVGVVEWSWLWVLAPLWISAGLAAVIVSAIVALSVAKR